LERVGSGSPEIKEILEAKNIENEYIEEHDYLSVGQE
tara:strand:- start:32 stop:142 length:111 start_codon:yes stop_codon:yes gene_type:complete